MHVDPVVSKTIRPNIRADSSDDKLIERGLLFRKDFEL